MDSSKPSLTRQIAGPLESLANLLYLLEDPNVEPVDRNQYLRLAQRELAQVLSYVRQAVDTAPPSTLL